MWAHWGSEQQEELRYQLNDMRNCFFMQKLLPFVDYIMLMRGKIPGSPRFSVLQAAKSWAGAGELSYSAGLSNILSSSKVVSSSCNKTVFKQDCV